MMTDSTQPSHRRSLGRQIGPMLALSGLVLLGGCDQPTPAGRTYMLEIPAHHWTQPAGIGRDIAPFVPTFALHFDAEDESRVYLGAATPEDLQDPCVPTTVASFTLDDEGSFQLDPVDFPVRIPDIHNEFMVSTAIYGLEIDGVGLMTQGENSGGRLAATMDVREVIDLFHLLPEPDPIAACNAIVSTGGACEPCTMTDHASYCLRLGAIDVVARELAGVQWQTISTESALASCPAGLVPGGGV